MSTPRGCIVLALLSRPGYGLLGITPMVDGGKGGEGGRPEIRKKEKKKRSFVLKKDKLPKRSKKGKSVDRPYYLGIARIVHRNHQRTKLV